jgi:hypothetical protein
LASQVVGILKLVGFLGVKLGEAAGDASVRRERCEAEVEHVWPQRSENHVSLIVMHSGGNHPIATLAAGFSSNTDW